MSSPATADAPKVARLPDTLANQIAAGEVVERPANVVKELVENALDAGAKKVTVVVEDGGRKRIEVVDDGRGMSREDALLAMERHTTSKLRTADDLFDIHTFGFRGEALPSIASVGKFELVTRRADDVSATRLVVEGGKRVEVADAGAPQGTRIVVTDLFFNVPARLKFLKSKQTEVGHVVDWVGRLALANPGVSFTVLDGTRTLLRAEATTDLKERVAAVLGRELAEAMYPVAYSADGVSVSGFGAGPQRQTNTSRDIHVFVNGRYVRDRQLLFSVSRAYDGVLQIGRSPAALLFLDVDPSRVDVNVHPQKLEVRFDNARAVTDAVVKALTGMLAGSPWLAASSKQAPVRTYKLEPATAAIDRNPAGIASNPTAPAAPAVPLTPQQQRLASLLTAAQKTHGDQWKDEPEPVDRAPPKPVEPAPAKAGSTIATLFPMPEKAAPARRSEEKIDFRALRYLGQVERTYLVCESPDGLVLIDQHAAHERVLYEKFRIERAGVAKQGQPLLVPITLEFSPSDARLVESALEALADLGFELEPFGGTSFALKTCPPELEGSDLPDVIRELATDVRDQGRAVSADRLEDALLTRMSCHAAVRKGHQLTPEEVRALLELIDGTPFHAQCPHGRPVVVRFDSSTLKEMFERTYEGQSRTMARDRLGRGTA